MTLPDELLPASQHYTLLAIAIALFTFVVLSQLKPKSKRTLVILTAVVVFIPIFHMGIEVFLATSFPWSSANWRTNTSLWLHGVAIVLVGPIAIWLAVAIRSPRARLTLTLRGGGSSLGGRP